MKGGEKGAASQPPSLPPLFNIFNGPRAQPRGVIDMFYQTTVISTLANWHIFAITFIFNRTFLWKGELGRCAAQFPPFLYTRSVILRKCSQSTQRRTYSKPNFFSRRLTIGTFQLANGIRAIGVVFGFVYRNRFVGDQ